MTITVGQRVALIKEIEHYQIGVFEVGLTGTVHSVDAFLIEVLLDKRFEALDDWGNILEIDDSSELNGSDYTPEAHLRVLQD
ncbi:MAG TPA: hypothetical protein VGV39_00370 [Mesorhizobium sp.]|jgi:hypothetical protein|uniref:hypothetical protein n=1 Tax=Mesorhizobium sp. TaxID=1871066 RepID=UPI002DDD99D7|nr:hypothetical protein [Mesorhizobium sp.]HEV2501495.1 hypothetical protein [Mesorhizobium sp.]